MSAQKYPNFYENIKEANMRLQYTVVLYDGAPYYILCICDGRPDGIFRVYMEATGHPLGSVLNRIGGVPHDYPAIPEKGKLMDEWMDKNPDSGIIRKKMNSPVFNRFRPFPLGMCNLDSTVIYLERQPQRQTHQGLTNQMICQSTIALESGKPPRFSVDMLSPAFKDCILGVYPSINDSIKNLLDPDIMNNKVGFHRHFALVKGPIDTLFLVYKSDIIGMLVNGDTSRLRLSSTFEHTKEVVANLCIFDDIIIR